MRKLIRAAAALLLGTSLAAAASAQPPGGAAPPAVPPLTPPAGLVPPAAPSAPAPAKIEKRPEGNAAVVTTTLGAAPVVQQIPEVAVYRGLRQFPESSRELARKDIIGHLVENVLLDHYLVAIKMNVEPKDVDALIAELKKELVAVKKDYAAELAAMMLTEEEFRAEVQAQLKWEAFVKQQSTDVALQQLFASSPDVFDGSMVRARHILFTPAKTNEAEQKEAAGKLRGIKQVIEQEAAKAVAEAPATADALTKEQIRTKKTEDLFAAFATRDSQCPSKKDGGDLNFFPRAGAMVEPFAKAAFDTKIYQMSDVVITEFGYHLILVTARKAGTPKKYEEVKEDVKLLYAMKLREAVLAQVKPKSKIEIMPVAGAAATPPAGTVPVVGGNVPK